VISESPRLAFGIEVGPASNGRIGERAPEDHMTGGWPRRDGPGPTGLESDMSDTLPSPVQAGLLCRCPRCGRGRLFRGLVSLSLADRCPVCGLDYSFVDAGDGPAVFAIFILGFLVLGGALIAEFAFAVPIWGHVLLWGILTPLLALGLLRVLKATLAALQFRYKAHEAGSAHLGDRDA
jgi:uncharacterized protein (DUF983 family)